MSFFRLIGLLMLALIAPSVALAATGDTSVSVPWGDWVQAAVGLLNQIALPLVAAIVAWASRILPAALVGYLKMLQVEQLLNRAVGWGLSSVSGAAAGRELKVDVGNQVLAAALTYAIQHAPSLVEWAGGSIALREKIIARLTLEPGATVSTSPAGVASLQ